MGNTISSLSDNSGTIVGYIVVVGVAAAFYWQFQTPKTNQQNVQRLRAQERALQPKKENNAKKQRKETFKSDAKQSSPKSDKSYASVSSVPQTKASNSKDTQDDDVDNRAFAQQMTQNKQSKFVAKASTEQKQKSVKQSKAKAISEQAEAKVAKESAPSSTAGGDGDDDNDASSNPSPVVSPADATGVSDMLEQAAPGPSVLRLTGTEEKQPQKPKQAKTPQPIETKKQRQNRRRKEQEKEQREREEETRKILLEAQRRRAREAEGRPAKDGSASKAAQKPSVWAGEAINGNSAQEAAPAAVHEPLDTFDSTSKVDTTTPAAAFNGKENGKKNNKANGKQNGTKMPDWADVSMTEEEQMAELQKQDEERNQWTVAKSRKNKKTNPGVANSETSSSTSETPAPATTKATWKKSTSEATNGRPKPQTQSSFAALNDDGADLEEESENNEWDV